MHSKGLRSRFAQEMREEMVGGCDEKAPEQNIAVEEVGHTPRPRPNEALWPSGALVQRVVVRWGAW